MSDFLIKDFDLRGSLSIELPRSKSYATRLLILAARSSQVTHIKKLPQSSDVRFLLNVFPALGIKVKEEGDLTSIEGGFPACEILSNETVVLETGDGGATNRFLAALLSLGENRYRLNCSEGFRARPVSELKRVFNELNVFFDNWEIKGPCQLPQELTVDCSQTTQFYTAFKLCFADEKCRVLATRIAGSHRYIELTNYLFEEFDRQDVWQIPLDFSSLAPLVSMAIYERRECSISGLFAPDPLQADNVFLNFLEDRGIKLSWRADGLYIPAQSRHFDAFTFNGEESPDLLPSLVFFACICIGRSKLSGLQRLKIKESDRLDWILRLLTLFDIDHEYLAEEDQLIINGKGEIKRKVQTIRCPDDHRIIMLAWNLARAAGGGLLENVDNVKKSFPDFFMAYK